MSIQPPPAESPIDYRQPSTFPSLAPVIAARSLRRFFLIMSLPGLLAAFALGLSAGFSPFTDPMLLVPSIFAAANLCCILLAPPISRGDRNFHIAALVIVSLIAAFLLVLSITVTGVAIQWEWDYRHGALTGATNPCPPPWHWVAAIDAFDLPILAFAIRLIVRLARSLRDLPAAL